MRILLATVFALAIARESWSQEKWPIEFGIDVQAVLSGPLVKQIKSDSPADYEKLMADAAQEIGQRPDKMVAMSGGYPKLAEPALFPRAPYLVYEFVSTEDAAAAITNLKMTEKNPRGFCPAYPNAVAYSSEKSGLRYVHDGKRIAVITSSNESADAEIVTTVLTNHPLVMKTISAGRSHLYLFVDGSVFNTARQIPLPDEMAIVKPLLNATSATWHATVTDKILVELKGTFINEKEAEEAREAAEQLLALASITLNVAKAEIEKNAMAPKDWRMIFDSAAALRKNAKPQVDGTSLIVKTTAPLPGNAGAFVAEMIVKAGEAAERVKSANNLKQITLALHIFHDNHSTFVTNIHSSGDQPKALLSWRVRLLPYLGQEELFQEFKLDEAWDSDHNKKLIGKIPKVYLHPKSVVKEPGMTHYRTFAPTRQGEIKSLLPSFPGEKWDFAKITDGLSNTIFVAEAADPVIWTKPESLPFDPKGKLPRLGGLFEGGFHVSMGDGSVRFLPNTIKDEKLKAMITANGGEIIRDNE
jgi:hypothetical protein